ncbi:xanthine dehydrogenase family protein molybdopterin-binding subunit [Variovorax sp. KBS0712]|uniref:xanthine dehydrogenase family protein molybdopterin-binding subunit n=1 Tax=Variovorax sp. KBS0712 TaxID=2578111 RepID=UPI00111B46E9|nr:xanthine dehydrogenase family protein molybdopterin-binding subunit [Variovorax sp. KBS0712]TSD59288.1 xanthine dehydrogenase family protein molybdopterin-binding subunit [Variovorax sp. KBS0712]
MPTLKRRHFVLGTLGAAGALVVGWAATPAASRLVPGAPLPAGNGQVALNGWVKVGSDDTVTLVMTQSEMGQGTHTGLAMLLAEEMDAAVSQVRLEQAGFDAIYNNQAMILDALPFRPGDEGFGKRAAHQVVGKLLRTIPGLSGTGGSSSVTDQWGPVREAGASARLMLVGAAAAQWQVPASECRTEAGRVLHPASNRSARFGELAAKAAQQPLPTAVKLKAQADFRVIGQPQRRIDNAGKLNGTATYGIDVLPQGLLYASIAMCPTLAGRVARFDAKAAEALPGVRKVMALEPVAASLVGTGSTAGGVAVIADTPYHAMRALKQVDIEWDHGPAASLSSAEMIDRLARTLDADAGNARLDTGGVAAALKSAARTIEVEYRVPFLAHATMEPMNCTVQFKDGAATVWAPTQAPGFARAAVAKALGIDAEKVTLHVTYLGGGFGRRYFIDFLVQAAQLAREAGGAPVQLIWSREEDMTHDFYRPAYVALCKAGFDAAGALVAWQTTSAGSSLGAPSFMDNSTDGAWNTAYDFPQARVAHVPVESAVTTGIWRSVAHSQNGFFVESFIDECAVAAGKDPVAFRAGLLAKDARHLAVLKRVAELSKWGEPLADGPDGTKRARGVAIHRAFGSIVAQVAEVSVTPERQIRVHRVVCVIDCGLPVNPNLIRQQMEGGIVFGLSAALRGEITVARGQVQQSNFHDYTPLRIDECPAIEVDILAGTGAEVPPGGVGEPGTPPIAPAVANAVFALTGQRLRSLPLRLA